MLTDPRPYTEDDFRAWREKDAALGDRQYKAPMDINGVVLKVGDKVRGQAGRHKTRDEGTVEALSPFADESKDGANPWPNVIQVRLNGNMGDETGWERSAATLWEKIADE